MKNSRWTANPITKNGHVVATRPNVAGDLEILKWLGRYPLLTADDLVALTNRPYKSVIRRLNKLKRKPNQFIKVCDGQREQPRIYQWTSQALQLAPNGIAKLHEIGFEPKTPKASIHFIHQLTESQVGAAFHALPIITFDEILAAPHTPKGAKKSIPVQFTLKGKDYDYDLTPDGEPFGIKYRNGTYRFCVFETDCASEPLTSSNRDRQTLEQKFAAYLTVLGNGLYESHWGFPNLTVLFTTTTKLRMENMIELLASMTADRKLLACFGFTLFPTILQGNQPDKGWAAKPWARVHGTLTLGETDGTTATHQGTRRTEAENRPGAC